MDRYTFMSDGYPAVKENVCYMDQNEDYCGDAIDRLAAYEDTELMPSEVEFILGEYERFTKMEREGRLIVLPCKAGDTVYRICPKCNDDHEASCDGCAWENTGGVEGCRVFGLWGDGQFPANKCTIVPWVATYHRMPTVIDKLGSRIFLTREEAEAALGGDGDDSEK